MKFARIQVEIGMKKPVRSHLRVVFFMGFENGVSYGMVEYAFR